MTTVRSILLHPAADSLWAHTAPAAMPVPHLEGASKTDVVIVGAGYTGLSVALHLAQLGARVCVLDAHAPGWGASGRNGGQVNPTLKFDPEDLYRMFGARAEALIEAVSGSADMVFGLIERYGMDCHPVRAGWLQVGYSDKAVAGLHRRAEQWRKLGVPVACLDRDAVCQRTGTTEFAGGWLDGRAGGLQPLAYAYGLARAACQHGVQIYGDSPVAGLERHGEGWRVRTATGASVDAPQVVLATNGYTDPLWPGLARTVLAANSFIVATPPLGERGMGILDGGETVSTAQRLLLYFRKDHAGRLLMGGRGHFQDPSGPLDFAHLERSLKLLYPQLESVSFPYRWAGRIAVTRDFLPHVHQPAPGLTMALGCNGRGIALATSMGKHLADLLSGGNPSAFPYPLSEMRSIPLHGLQRFYIAAGVAWYSLLDRLETRRAH
ncbi:NAD(P)/FAD-dependent oxidoreductase [Corticimicrobacter populi]|uniref:FAD-dependent oxidoreductase n=1 Tax=Corticimicrobacter populi TaxID=2175229 RepID=A0A2V1JYS2_9BURK|nr:FAD-binding oxidoreductase [Corticimicrobacter populi]PWF23929.1 FAD-dependent oxidoreductase [Corticimicrobacter populi]